jgi:dynein heavy chain 2
MTSTFFFELSSADKDDKLIVFFKTRPEVITPDNLHSNVFVSTMLDSPVTALYHAVQKVYAPVLLKDEKWSKNFDPKLQSLLTELEAGLGSVIRKQDASFRGPTHDGNEDNLGGLYIHAVLILCLTHFFAFRNSDPCR